MPGISGLNPEVTCRRPSTAGGCRAWSATCQTHMGQSGWGSPHNSMSIVFNSKLVIAIGASHWSAERWPLCPLGIYCFSPVRGELGQINLHNHVLNLCHVYRPSHLNPRHHPQCPSLRTESLAHGAQTADCQYHASLGQDRKTSISICGTTASRHHRIECHCRARRQYLLSILEMAMVIPGT